jgi:prefoldin subunit 4
MLVCIIEPHLLRIILFDLQKTLEKIDDASTELMMGSGDNVMLRLGGAMFDATEEEATEYCEAEVERHQEILDKLLAEEGGIVERQGELKKLLYGRFGKSINLEA